MKRVFIICLFLGLTTTFLLSQSNPVSLIEQSLKVAPPVSASAADPQARTLDSYGKLPLSFEANQGQTDARVKFLSRTGGYTVFLTADESVLELQSSAVSHQPSAVRPPSSVVRPAKSSVVRMRLEGANGSAKISGSEPLPGVSNYFIGKDPVKWRTNVPTYAKVTYEGIYPGIDLIYYGNQRQLEYDFVVAPGADPRRIAFEVHGAKRIRRNAHGDLVLKVGEGEIRWHKPVAYQEKDGARQLVAASYAVTDGNRVRFEVAKYDASRTLYIDPLIYSTFLGGSGYDSSNAIAVDTAGNAYVTGRTNSTDFAVTPGAFQTNCNDCTYNSGDAFVTKINASGSALVYSTYLGGSYVDGGGSIAVDSAGNAYVTGGTSSTDFPVTPGAFQTGCAGGCQRGDAFVAKINPSGSALVYSTYLGGSDSEGGNSIVVDSAKNAYVTGTTCSTDFPTTPGAFQTIYGGGGPPAGGCSAWGGDAFVTKINPTGSALVYSTYLGGSYYEQGAGIAVDDAGNPYVSGSTQSCDFPVTPGAFRNTCGGGYPNGTSDAFVAKIDASGSALAYSTYLGGSSDDWGGGIAVDSAGNAYVTGQTGGKDFPVTAGAFQTSSLGWSGFVSKLNPAGSSLVYSTYLGGRHDEGCANIAVDSAGTAYVTGISWSTNFPVTPGAVQKKCNNRVRKCEDYGDAFVTRLNPTGSALVYSTFLGGSGIDDDSGGGIAADSVGNAYVTGYTISTDFPTMNPLQTYRGGGDAFVSKIDVRPVPMITLTSSISPSTYGEAVTVTATVTSVLGMPPDGETMTFMKGKKVLGTGTLRGGSASFTTSTLSGGDDYIKAVYGGDAGFAPRASKVLKQVVNKATTTTTLTSSLNPSNYGQAVTFTASLMPEYSGTVKGTVTFYDGTTALATKSLSGGVAKFTTSTMLQGTHTITAAYNGNANFLGSSGSITQTVN